VDFLGKARFDRYRFVAVLGKGSFAEVAKYEVVDAASPAHPLHDGGGAAPAAAALLLDDEGAASQRRAGGAGAGARAGARARGPGGTQAPAAPATAHAPAASAYAPPPVFVAIKSVNRQGYRSGVNLGAVKELQTIQECGGAGGGAGGEGGAGQGPEGAGGFADAGAGGAHALLGLAHPNVVRMFEAFPFGDRVHLVLEFCASDLGATLRDRSLPLTEAHVKGFLRQLLRGVAHVHASGLMHRDLKPDNVLLTAGGVVKLADFGHAGEALERSAGDFEVDAGAGTGAGAGAALGAPGAAGAVAPPARASSVAQRVLGAAAARLLAPRAYFYRVVTLWYRAPELLLGALFYSPAVDMWAVGAILAEMLLRQPLFAGSPQRGESEEQAQLAQIFRVMGTPVDPLADARGAEAAFAEAGGLEDELLAPADEGAASAASAAPRRRRAPRPRALAANLTVWPGCASLPGFAEFEPRRAQPWRAVFPLEMGSPPNFLGPGASALALDLLSQLLVFDPRRRLTAEDALRHPWFAAEPAPAPPAKLPVRLSGR